MNLKMKRKILSTLLNVMYAHRHDTVVVRNSCLILCQFELPHDVKFEYEKLVKILLFIISEHTSEDGAFVQRASICLLNSLACQVEGKQKLLVGDLGAMEKMLDVIKSKLQSGMFLCCYRRQNIHLVPELFDNHRVRCMSGWSFLPPLYAT